MPEILQPGTYIGAPMGHYQSAYIVEHARLLGWEPEPQKTGGIFHTARTQEEENEYVDEQAVTYQEWGHVENMDEWYEIVTEAEQWINDNCVPEGHWYGHHPDIGDVGVWLLDSHCETCYHESGLHDDTMEAPCLVEGCNCETLLMEV